MTPRPARHPQAIVSDRHRRVVRQCGCWEPFDAVGRGVDPEDRSVARCPDGRPVRGHCDRSRCPGTSMTAAGSTEVMAGTAFGVAVATASGVADDTAIDGVVDDGVDPDQSPREKALQAKHSRREGPR